MRPSAVWTLGAPDPATVRSIASALSIRPELAAALTNRGVTDPEAAAAFFNPRLSLLHDPWRMAGMDRAVARTLSALREGEKIGVYGDYDADGITATALLSTFFREIGIPVDAFIPDRARDGYGLNPDRIRDMAGRGVSLILAVDCGVRGHAEIAHAAACGVDVIVLDHHEPGDTLPDAVAVVDPHRSDCGFPFKDLAAVGVAFHYVGAVRSALIANGRIKREAVDLRSYLDLVALGTIADVVPLVGDNRILAAAGLEILNRDCRVGMTALKAVAGTGGKPVTAGTVAFHLAPRLNATGRLGDPRVSLDLLLSRDPEEAKRHADVLQQENDARRRVEQAVLNEANACIAAEGGPMHKIVVVAGVGWHPGVVGIVASRLVETHRRPAVVIAIEDGIGRGSCRSIPGFDIGQALHHVGRFLQRFGGHPMAAGLALDADRIPAFTDAISELADREIPDSALAQKVRLDAEMPLSAITPDLLPDLARFQPHGIGNPEPVFGAFGVVVTEARRIGRDQAHLALTFSDGDCRVPAVWWGAAAELPQEGTVMDVAFSVEPDAQQGRPRLKVRDLRPHEVEHEGG